MYLEKVPNRNSRLAILLREGWRGGKKIKKRTLANLSDWPEEQVEALGLLLKGEKLAPVDALFEKVESKHHGHIQSVLRAINRLGLDKVISAKRCKERDIIMAAIAARIGQADSKLAMTRWWGDTTLPEQLGVEDADEDDIYEAMDWLLARQKRIERKLARRHFENDDLVLYDLSSSYFEGVACPLSRMGKSRDRKRNTLQVNYGLVADRRGCPVAVSVLEGNTGDTKTLLPRARRVHEDFGIERVVLVGDRGMISQRQIDELREAEGFDWITALETSGIRKRAHKRESMLEATMRELSKICAAEAVLDGIYIIRTSLPADRMDADETVRSYKNLTNVERAIRTLTSIDLLLRPIRHRTEDRVRAHIFLSMLTYYVQWHMLEAWRPLLFADEDQEGKKTRDTVAPSKRSKSALGKVHSKRLDDESAVHSFRTLLHHMSTITRDFCRCQGESDASPPFKMDTKPNEKQHRALELIDQISV